MRLIPILFVAVSSLAVHRTADACSIAHCWTGYLTPSDGASVPANLPALHWRPRTGFGGAPPDPALVTLATTMDPGVALGLTPTVLPDGDYVLVPDQPLVAGTSYILRDHNVCDGEDGPSAVFTVGPAAPLPASLGTLRATARGVAALEVETDGGSCSSQIDADQATIDLDLAPEVAPWRDVLHFETRVDDKPWHPQTSIIRRDAPGTSWRGRGVDLVYRTCRTDDPLVSSALDAGAHVVAMRATLPGSTAVVSSTSVVVELACASDDSGGCSAGGSQAAPWLVLALGALAARKRR